jgi:hypothetical protein
MDQKINYMRWIALTLMIVDHVAIWFFDNNLIMRFFGQASYPVFAWLIIQGDEKTKDWEKYLYRLLVLGIISQLPYMALGMEAVNPILGLACGLAIIRAYEEKEMYSGILFVLFAVIGVNSTFGFRFD